MKNLIIKGHLSIENSKGHLMGSGKKQLLEKIKETGSIKAAATEMKISYRHAWEMIKKMNATSDVPLVIKNTGGSSGGGSVVTKEGEELIACYIKLNVAFEEFKEQICKTI
ncbi:winged helix-turn-helix domain-containing protein [Flavobacterium alvei]|nr:LysR family transcriptional regulator [Flavobacterium alvei]